MSDLERTINVLCPVSQAKMHLDRFFDEHGGRDADNGSGRLAGFSLRAPAPGGVMQRDVNVTLLRHAHPLESFDSIDVKWEVPDSGVYPKFSGVLSVEANDDYNSFTLALRGEYTPPGGFVGHVFDAAIGHRIAEATADDLLRQMRDSIERSYHAVEAAKRTDPAQPA